MGTQEVFVVNNAVEDQAALSNDLFLQTLFMELVKKKKMDKKWHVEPQFLNTTEPPEGHGENCF